MKNMFLQKILIALFYTFIVVIVSVSVFGIGNILAVIPSYSTVEGSFHLLAHAFLIGLIFTVIFCTMVLLEKMEKE